MKPALFSYRQPGSLAEALALLAEHGFDAKVIAGGQSLVPMMNMRFAQPQYLVDLNGLPELAGIERHGDSLRIGAMTRHHDVATSDEVRRSCPLLAMAAQTIAHYAIRQRGTLGGSLANADPAAQWLLMAQTLEARIEVASQSGVRELPASDFALGAMSAALEPEDIIIAARFPCLREDEGCGFEIFSRRHGDFSIASCAATVRLEHGKFKHVRIGVGGVSDVPVLLRSLADACVGRYADEAAMADMAGQAVRSIAFAPPPGIDVAFQRDLVGTLVARTLARACRTRE